MMPMHRAPVGRYGMPQTRTVVGAPSFVDNTMAFAAWTLPGVRVGAASDGFIVADALRWTHTDSRGIETAVNAGIARGKAGQFDDPGAVADLRGLVVGAFALYDVLSRIIDVDTAKIMQIGVRSPDDFGDENRHELALCGPRALMAAATLAAKIAPSTGENMFTSAMTVDGGPPTDMTVHPVDGGGTAVGFGWPAAVVVIVGIAGAVYLGERALDIYNAHALRDDNIKAMIAAAAKAVEVAKNHAEVEATAGKPVPLNSAEVAVVSALNKQVETTAKANDITLQPKPSSIFPDTTKIVDTAIKTTGAVLGVGTALVVGGVVLAGVLVGPKLLDAYHGHGG